MWVGPREHDYEPEGFNAKEDISLSASFDLVKQMHPTATALTIRKFLIGLALHDKITGYAEHYFEGFERIDNPQYGPYQGWPEKFVGIPHDFWQIDMAILQDFASGCLVNESEVTKSELPYRMRSSSAGYGDLDNERVMLHQKATNIHFPKADLVSFAQDPEWQSWGSTAKAISDPRKKGRPTAWKWDEVKVALTIEASTHPAVLQNLGSIVQFINSEMKFLHYEQLPNQKEVYAYARLFAGHWREPDPNDIAP